MAEFQITERVEGRERIMAKTVLIVWDDYYHPEANYREAVRKSFEENEMWEVIKTHHIRDLLKMEKRPDLCINFTVGIPQGEPELTQKEEEQMKAMVEGGMGMMFIHAGLACIRDNTPLFTVARGRFASHPEPHYEVYCTGLPGNRHPVMNGVEPFQTADEHYFCKIDIENVTPFMTALSDAGTEIAGWSHILGKGRVCCLTPGHNHPMMIKMRPVMENAARWCIKEL